MAKDHDRRSWKPSALAPPLGGGAAAGRYLRAAIVGGGKGCKSIIEMVRGDTLGRFRMMIVGVADKDPDAPGMVYARETGVELVATDYRDLFAFPGLDLVIELTGSDEVRDEVERTRPRGVQLIDHFGARLFWELHQAEEAILAQRNEMRERVEAERERITQIFDSIPDEIVVVDMEMVIHDANRAFLRNNDLTIDEVRGLHCYDVEQGIRGECQVAVGSCPFREVTRDGKPVFLVRKHYNSDGAPRWAAIVAAPLLDRSGELMGVIEMTRDITHRISLEQELKATEGRIKEFMANAPIATYIKNRQGVYVEVNSATCRLFGKERGEIIGKTDLEILPREAAEAMREHDKEVLQDGSHITFETEVELDGTRRFLSTVKYPVLDATDRVTAVCGLSADVTAQREAKAELNRTREYLHNILDHSPAIIITTDMEARVVSFYRGDSEALGYTHEDIVGQPASMLYTDPTERDALLRRVQSEGAVRDYQTELVHKDGHKVPVSITISLLKNDADEVIGTVGISKDISHRKALLDQIIQSERMAAVGRLAAGVAHEINNPLAIIGEIAGYLGDITSGGPGAEDADAAEELRVGLPKIEQQVNRCRSITHRLLSLARKTEARVKVCDVSAALDEVLPFLEKEARLNQVEIFRECRGEHLSVRVEEIQLQEIFINLIQNAVQALAPQKQGHVWVSCEERDKKVVVTVRDDGPGVPEEVRDRLFDPFVTTKPLGKGTGLGLSICYGIVKRYDGEIRVYSTPGEGAAFEVILPAAAAECAEPDGQ